MNSILLEILPIKKATPKQQGDRNAVLLISSNSIGNYQEVEMLAENLWLIPVESAMPFFCNIASQADTNQIRYRILVLEDKPKWLVYPKVA